MPVVKKLKTSHQGINGSTQMDLRVSTWSNSNSHFRRPVELLCPSHLRRLARQRARSITVPDLHEWHARLYLTFLYHKIVCWRHCPLSKSIISCWHCWPTTRPWCSINRQSTRKMQFSPSVNYCVAHKRRPVLVSYTIHDQTLEAVPRCNHWLQAHLQ